MSNDEFRCAFKYYKSRKPPPDFSLPIDIWKTQDQSTAITRIKLIESQTYNWSRFGLKNPHEWDAHNVNNNGLIYIKNPFYNIGQRYWITRCLRDFPKKPNKLNIDPHFDAVDTENWWKSCNLDISEKSLNLKRSLRWATLGYHHDWDSKHYSDENQHPFPSDLAELCQMILSCFAFEDYIAQASIVNYYHMDSTLAPHTDHSEKNLDAPLISISFGQSAIFLIGESKSVEPTALYIHSGDVIIMSAESRLCYHAVPRIVKAEYHPWIIGSNCSRDCINEDVLITDNYNDYAFWKPFEDYLSDSRININVRQVLYKDQKSLNDIR